MVYKEIDDAGVLYVLSRAMAALDMVPRLCQMLSRFYLILGLLATRGAVSTIR